MYVDAQTQVSAAQAFTATAVSTNSIDMTTVDPDIAEGNPIGFGITVDVAADFTTTNETYVFDIIDDDDPALASAVILATMPVLALQLTLGRRLKMPVPPGRTTSSNIRLTAFAVSGAMTCLPSPACSSAMSEIGCIRPLSPSAA